jgi:DNA-binding MarR family transcriptional regulator
MRPWRNGDGSMSYSPEWILGASVVLVALLCAPPLALIGFGVLLLAVLAALVALAGAIAATPYLLFRTVRRRWAPSHYLRSSQMNASTSRQTSTDPLVEALATRLRRIDLIAWAQITARAEELGLSFEDLRLLLALAVKDGPCSVSDLAHRSGLSIDAAYPAVHALHGRGYVREDQRRYSLTDNGRELVATLDAAHREGIQAYVDGLDPSERQRLDEAIRIAP